jgi:DNA replication and repair protein RecF
MQITKARFSQFRNIDFCDLSLSGKNHFMLGVNGQGKSNCLEAIGFISALRSFRTQLTKPLFQKNTNEFHLLYEIEHERLGITEVELRIKQKEKVLLIDGDPVKRLADFIGLFPVVPLHSGDLMILRGSPSERRRFFDMTLASVDPEYFHSLRMYYKAIQERNQLLKMNSKGQAFDAFEKELAKCAYSLVVKRREGTEDNESPVLAYKPDTDLASTDAYEQLFAEQRKKDQIMGSTGRGPHRDDYSISLAIGGAKEYGSDGQQRGLSVALRMAQASLFEKKLGIKPVILIDDILGELDPKRKKSFWATCSKEIQIIASGTEFSVEGASRDWQVWDVNNGNFKQTDSTD